MRIGLIIQHLPRHLRTVFQPVRLLVVVVACVSMNLALAAQQALQLTIHWDKTAAVSKSSPTLQVDVNPRLEHGRPLSIAAYKTVKVQGASYARYVP
jgi:hypothetical protein